MGFYYSPKNVGFARSRSLSRRAYSGWGGLWVVTRINSSIMRMCGANMGICHLYDWHICVSSPCLIDCSQCYGLVYITQKISNINRLLRDPWEFELAQQSLAGHLRICYSPYFSNTILRSGLFQNKKSVWCVDARYLYMRAFPLELAATHRKWYVSI